MAGLRGRMRRANLAKRTLDPYNRTPGTLLASHAWLSQIASGPERLAYAASENANKFQKKETNYDGNFGHFSQNFCQIVDELNAAFVQAVAELQRVPEIGAAAEVRRAIALMAFN